MTGPAPLTPTMNERAWALADACETRAAELRVRLFRLRGGTRVIDAGVDTPGGLGAGLALAHMCLGGLGQVSLTSVTVGDSTWDGVHVWTDHPARACMAAQYAGWAITPDGYFALGSGPLRAVARVEQALFAKLACHEAGARGVLALETRTLPTDAVADWIATRAGIPAEGLTLVVAPTASLAGSVQVSARIVETGLHKMDVLGFDVTRVRSASGLAPVAPIGATDLEAIGRTNDCVLYGGSARYTIDASDEELAALAARLPASASRDYGEPFERIFRRYDRDFYRIDPLLFSPAEVWLTSTVSGRTVHAGRGNAAVLRASLLGG